MVGGGELFLFGSLSGLVQVAAWLDRSQDSCNLLVTT
jgi:hypothetical protein